ncbi:DUF3618 domain-containing protein [Streptomyces carpinensis]|uniref:DUF3618 domain-containing protein n=1 Tax=Streptomyces carpinensis TaxID=66369 RepID=A0ABV1WKN9_9ACTN|nr:DUF3618 domain-containing protein [Streptomyces carpinensis]
MTDRTQGADGGSRRALGAKGPDELRAQIEQTRNRLGDTVEELAAKADVRGRAKARAADLRDRAGAMTVQLRSTAVHAGHRAQEKATLAGHKAQERVGVAGHRAQEKTTLVGHRAQERATLVGHRAQERASQVGHRAEHAVPGPVTDAVQACRRNPRPLMIAGVACAAVLTAGLLVRRYRQKECQ